MRPHSVRSAADRGQTSFEYLGIAVVIAVIIGVLATTGIGDAVQQAILDAIGKISGGGGGGGGGGAGGGGGGGN